MTAERWARIKTVLNAALEREKDERRAFLDATCGADAELRREVERLLAGEDEASLASPAAVLLEQEKAPEFAPGQRLGHYRIEAKAGTGGMGTVYRAHDTRLGREVALKVLPECLAGNSEAMARFEREAHMLASLNHPNIASIHGLEENAIVMEFVEGVTLAERIAKGPLPVDAALGIAGQIAEALEYAHERGVIHRDLKPANVKITREGAVKVLDFGLAKMMFDEGVDTISTSHGLGAVVGTPAYMAPEQASGDAVDRRADIWAFGVVLYEMLTARRLFDAGSVGETLTAVLGRNPDFSLLPKETPAWVVRLLSWCLERDRKKRLRDIGDAWAKPGASAQEPHAATAHALPAWIAAVAFAAVAAMAIWAPWRVPRAPARAPLWLDIDIDGPFDSMAVSPDGMQVVFRAGGGPLVTRRLDQNKTVPLAGTQGARDPFFSPDGKWLGFFAGGKLRKIPVDGGLPITLCDAVDGRGGSWGEDGYIVAALNVTGGLARVPSGGGRPESITGLHGEVDDATTHRWPQVLPRGKGVLFTSHSAQKASLMILERGSTRPKVLLKSARDGRYLEGGHLIYYGQGSLIAAPMDLGRLEVTGPGTTLIPSAASFYAMGRVSFDVSTTGTLVYVRGRPEVKRVVSWIDSSGTVQPLLPTPGQYEHPRLSPDGKRLAITIVKGELANVWVYDASRDTMTPMPSDGDYQFAQAWSPDGEYLALQSDGKLAWARSDGSGRVETLAGTRQAFPYSFSPDGARLLFHQATGGNYDLWDVPVGNGAARFGQPRRLTDDPVLESSPAISPDGKWLAYCALIESARPEIFVARLLADGRLGGGKWQVSNRTGRDPVWARKGGQLFYRLLSGPIMAVPYTSKGDMFVPEKPRLWSDKVASGTQFAYDAAPDGKRVAVLLDIEDGAAKPETHLRVLVNAGEEIRRRAAAAGK